MDTKTSLPTRLAAALHAFPRRSLAAVLLFVALAGVIGGPIAGAMQSDGGFTPADSDSARAVERIEAATGQQPTAGILLLVDTPGGDQAGVDEALAALADIDGVAAAAPGGAAADGTSALVVGTLDAAVDEEAVAEDVVEELDGVDGCHRRRPGGGRAPARRPGRGGPEPRGAAGAAGPGAAVDPDLRRPRRGACRWWSA